MPPPKPKASAGAIRHGLSSTLGTINEQFFDALIRHQVGLLRLTGGIKQEVFKLLNATEQDIADKIVVRLARHKGLGTPASVNRLQTLMKSIRATRLRSWDQVNALWLKELTELSRAEPLLTDALLKTAVPTAIETTLPSVSLLKSIVSTKPFHGKVLKQWAKSIARADLERIEAQIKIGMVQGEGSAAIARRVVGTKLVQGKDGVTEIARRQAAGITRTVVNAISNQARREFFRENEAMFLQEVYVATLDNRTTPICSSLDGERFKVAEGPIPPLHFNCRSLRVAVIDGEVIGDRPMRPFTEPQMVREFSKSQGLKTTFTRRSQLPHGTKGKFDKFRAKRVRELTGRVPAKVTYEQWLRRQSVEFQNDVLGPARGRLFRKGGLTLDKFVDRKTGRRFTLDELKKKTGVPPAKPTAPAASPPPAPAGPAPKGRVVLDTTATLPPNLSLQARREFVAAASVTRRVKDMVFHKWARGWSNPLKDKSLRQALKTYVTTKKFSDINGFLRGQKGNFGGTEDLAIVSRLDKIISSSKVPENITVFRGIKELDKVLPAKMRVIGAKFTDPAFTSVAVDPWRASFFTRKEGAVFEIQLPKGQRAVSVHAGLARKANNLGESELLLPRGMSFEITDIVSADKSTLLDSFQSTTVSIYKLRVV